MNSIIQIGPYQQLPPGDYRWDAQGWSYADDWDAQIGINVVQAGTGATIYGGEVGSHFGHAGWALSKSFTIQPGGCSSVELYIYNRANVNSAPYNGGRGGFQIHQNVITCTGNGCLNGQHYP